MSETNQTAPLCSKCGKPVGFAFYTLARGRHYCHDCATPTHAKAAMFYPPHWEHATQQLNRLSAENAELRARADRAERELDEGDSWMERAKHEAENGLCLGCFSTDESGHKPGCYIVELEAKIATLEAALRGYGKSLDDCTEILPCTGLMAYEDEKEAHKKTKARLAHAVHAARKHREEAKLAWSEVEKWTEAGYQRIRRGDREEARAHERCKELELELAKAQENANKAISERNRLVTALPLVIDYKDSERNYQHALRWAQTAKEESGWKIACVAAREERDEARAELDKLQGGGREAARIPAGP